MNLTGRYIIDGYDLYEAYRVVVQSAEGLDVLPKVKKREQRDWAEESGLEVDTATRITYEALNIALRCFVSDSTYADAVKRINGLVSLLSDDGLHLLGSGLRKRMYPVLLQEVSSYERVTPATASSVVLQFTIKLLCPLPECRMGSATVEAGGGVTLVIPTGKDYTVWWGDGAMAENTLTHTYTAAGTYTILIAGTGVASALITATGATIDEYAYPASGDITHVDVSPTSAEAYMLANALAARVGKLEDNYILKYVVPVDSIGFDLTQDRYGRPFSFTDGDVIDIHFRIDAWVNNGGDLNRLNIRINDVVDSVYNYGNSFYNYMFTAGTSVKSQFPIFRVYVSKGELTYYLMDKYKNSSDAYGHSLYVGFTSGLSADSITKLTFFANLSTSLIPAGTEIIIKKL